MITKLSYMKRHLFALLAIPLLLGITFAAILPATGFTGMIVAEDDESDELSETETSEVEDEDDEDEKIEDSDDDEVDDEIEEKNEREVEIEVEDYSVQIKTQLKLGENKDEIKVKFTVDDNPKFKLEYESEVGDTETELDFTIKFKSITEYLDIDSNGVYNKSVDEELQVLKFEDMEFLPIEYSTSTVSNTTVHLFKSSSVDGMFTLQFYVAGEFTPVNGSLVAPTEVKIDIGIHDFPYLNESSRLALYTKLESEAEYEHDSDTEDETKGLSSDEEEEVEVEMSGFVGFFSWSELVVVDGQNMSIISSPVGTDDIDANEQKIYLNYPHGAEIIHDPKVGVAGILQMDVIQTPTNIPGFETLIAAFAFLTVAIVTVYRRRR
ncbi:hypothetical protein CEE45_02280 [Candidatus Heimdallarchaeota archaeon B3_Heim]|nr:MAG: hypothetical protein CEE45_02280 [Candidatus Heimdallarchaeota archaeon B3_Heim]